MKNALLHLEGHVHYGQYHDNYLNLGFLFWDSFHGAEALIGGIWNLELTEITKRIEYIDLGNNVMQYHCSHHPEEGTFYMLKYWKKCPVCYHPENAKFSQLTS